MHYFVKIDNPMIVKEVDHMLIIDVDSEQLASVLTQLGRNTEFKDTPLPCLVYDNIVRLAKAVNCSRFEEQCITIFKGSIRTKYILDPYVLRLVAFLSSIEKTCDQFVEQVNTNPTAENMLIGCILKEKQRADHRSIVTITCHGSLTAEILIRVYIRYCKVLSLLSNYLIQGPFYECRVVVGKEVAEILSKNELSS